MARVLSRVSGTLRGDFDGPMVKLTRQILRRTIELIDQKRKIGPEMWQKMNSSFHLIDRVADIVAEEWRAVPCMYESIRNSENISLVSWDPSTKLLILGGKSPQFVMILA